ncbi:hypothetical protein GTX14_29300 [Streptomyces sp. SID4944]|nr:hypothetical protein [Streptomyces sp. SID4944]
MPAAGGRGADRAGGRGRARVTFDWPAEAGEVAATVEQDGGSTVRRVTRSTYVREGLYVDVAPSAFSLTLSAAPRTPDAVVVPPPGGGTRVPPEITVRYRIVPGPRRALRRGPRCCGSPSPARAKCRPSCRSSCSWSVRGRAVRRRAAHRPGRAPPRTGRPCSGWTATGCARATPWSCPCRPASGPVRPAGFPPRRRGRRRTPRRTLSHGPGGALT